MKKKIVQEQMERIINFVAPQCEMFPAEVKIRTQKRHPAQVRWVIMWLARELTAASYPQIAKAVGIKDHTSVIYGEKRAIQLMKESEHHRRCMAEWREHLAGRLAV